MRRGIAGVLGGVTMTGPRRVLVVFGTRPEAIKLFPVITALRDQPRLATRTCATGQHRELLDQVLDLAGIVPDHDLAVMREGSTLDSMTAALIEGIGRVLDVEAPDWLVVQGDTASAFAAALAAYHRRIPVAHVEAGLRSGDLHQPWPEEGNRRLLAALASLHFAPTAAAAQALRAENVADATIHVTGNTGIDALHWVLARLEREPALGRGLEPLERRFAGKRVIAVTCHRRENLGAGCEAIAGAVRQVAGRTDVALVLPVHPNPAVRTTMERALSGLANVALLEPLDYPHFARLLRWCEIVLTDSGGVQEEAPALGKPVLVMRETTERGEGLTAGTARLVGTDADGIASAVSTLLDDPAVYARMARRHLPFGDGRAAQRISNILARAAT